MNLEIICARIMYEKDLKKNKTKKKTVETKLWVKWCHIQKKTVNIWPSNHVYSDLVRKVILILPNQT